MFRSSLEFFSEDEYLSPTTSCSPIVSASSNFASPNREATLNNCTLEQVARFLIEHASLRSLTVTIVNGHESSILRSSSLRNLDIRTTDENSIDLNLECPNLSTLVLNFLPNQRFTQVEELIFLGSRLPDNYDFTNFKNLEVLHLQVSDGCTVAPKLPKLRKLILGSHFQSEALLVKCNDVKMLQDVVVDGNVKLIDVKSELISTISVGNTCDPKELLFLAMIPLDSTIETESDGRLLCKFNDRY